ncbi:contractile injection system tape measure protein [Alteromonas sp. a30]|uniref:contractile injection system tape measure protein n=1 Tax=Alteromonas sp. a30 TaxID=2730917 RepID=UPI00227E5DA2|nr:contractile injection system tape measure protein [Alteromonas sp. a30]MCY7294204.1 hypothetical protein [Alteromonas sp. a30]
MAKHLINRVVFAFSSEDESNAKRQQDAVSRYFRSSLKPALDKALTRLSSSNELIRIDRLEIDLGEFRHSIDEQNVVRDLPQLLQSSIKRQIQDNKAKVLPLNAANTPSNTANNAANSTANSTAQSSAFHGFRGPDWDELPTEYQDFFKEVAEFHRTFGEGESNAHRGNDFGKNLGDTNGDFADHFDETDLEAAAEYFADEFAEELDDGFIEINPLDEQYAFRGEQDAGLDDIENQAAANESQDNEHALLFFLRHGVLPWWFKDADFNLVDELNVDNPQDAQALIECFNQHAALRERWVSHASFSQKLALLEHWPESLHNQSLAAFLLALFKQSQDALRQQQAPVLMSFDPLAQVAWHAIFSNEMAGKSIMQALPILLQAWSGLPHFSHWLALLENAPKTVSVSNAFLSQEQWQRGLEWLLSKAFENPVSANVDSAVSPMQHPAFMLGPQWIEGNAPLDLVPIHNAGLSLFIPHLQACFSELGWLEQDSGWFKSHALQQKALYWLNYLVLGEPDDTALLGPTICEPQVPLLKVLVGLHPANNIWGDCLLSEQEKHAADAWLMRFVSGFDTLAFASAQAVREALLQRPGLFGERGGTWLLRVQPEGRDILLQAHIQSFTSYLLPFMPIAIDVEWGE